MFQTDFSGECEEKSTRYKKYAFDFRNALNKIISENYEHALEQVKVKSKKYFSTY